jgi:hypothetical protein
LTDSAAIKPADRFEAAINSSEIHVGLEPATAMPLSGYQDSECKRSHSNIGSSGFGSQAINASGASASIQSAIQEDSQ